jgi:hypothetical protein
LPDRTRMHNDVLPCSRQRPPSSQTPGRQPAPRGRIPWLRRHDRRRRLGACADAPTAARMRLLSVPSGLRGWEWRHLSLKRTRVSPNLSGHIHPCCTLRGATWCRLMREGRGST